MPRLRAATRLGAAVVVLVAVLIPALVAPPPASAATAITGGGSGFAGLEIGQWTKDVNRAPYNLSVNYQSEGSGIGRGNFANGLFDFGASDIIYPPIEQAVLGSTARCGQPLSSCFKYVPVSAGGLGFMYNLTDSSGNRIRDIKLTRDEVCKIFTGQIRSWNDPELVGTNPELSAVQHEINVVTRLDSAGESYVLSQYCIAVDPSDWTTFSTFIRAQQGGQFVSDPGLALGQPVSVWPTGLMDGQTPGVYSERSGLGADGAANDVADPTSGPYSITYNAVAYANVRDFPVASVANAAGVFTQPTETNVTVALAYATPHVTAADRSGDGTFDLHFDGSDQRAYFPSTYSYILAQTAPGGKFTAGMGAALAQFLCYAVGLGQVDGSSPTLGYSRLSSQIVAISIAAIDKITGSGGCVESGPPPPAPIAVAPGHLAATATGGAATATGGTATGGTTATTTVGGTTTTTDVAGPTNPEALPDPQGAQLGLGATPGTLSASPLNASSSSSGPTNTEALWALIEGAAVCAIGLVLAGTRRGST